MRLNVSSVSYSTARLSSRGLRLFSKDCRVYAVLVAYRYSKSSSLSSSCSTTIGDVLPGERGIDGDRSREKWRRSYDSFDASVMLLIWFGFDSILTGRSAEHSSGMGSWLEQDEERRTCSA